MKTPKEPPTAPKTKINIMITMPLKIVRKKSPEPALELVLLPSDEDVAAEE